MLPPSQKQERCYYHLLTTNGCANVDRCENGGREIREFREDSDFLNSLNSACPTGVLFWDKMGQNGLRCCGTASCAVPTCPKRGTKWDKWDKMGQNGTNGTKWDKWDKK